MTVRPVNKNVTCTARQMSWATGSSIKLTETNDIVLKQCKIYFSAGCRSEVQIRIMLNGGQLLPDPLNNYSNAYIGADITHTIYLGKRLHQSDIISIEYINEDYSEHTISVMYELQPLDTETVQNIVPGPTVATPKAPAPIAGFLPDETEENKKVKIYREPKMGRVGDESNRAYVGTEEINEGEEWTKMDGVPKQKQPDPRKGKAQK